jgi:hypothetical protein
MVATENCNAVFPRLVMVLRYRWRLMRVADDENISVGHYHPPMKFHLEPKRSASFANRYGVFDIHQLPQSGLRSSQTRQSTGGIGVALFQCQKAP